jgi:hypothetical protein
VAGFQTFGRGRISAFANNHEWIDEDERRIEQLVPGTFSGHVLGGAADLSFERWPMLAKQR